MPAREPEPLFGTNRFRVVIGERELGFSEVGPLTSSTDLTAPLESRPHRFETVVLRRSLTASTELYDWRRRIVEGTDDRRTVTIQQLDSLGAIVNAWRLEGAWPCRWSGPAFNALANDIAIEELELAFDGLAWLEDPDSRTATEGA